MLNEEFSKKLAEVVKMMDDENTALITTHAYDKPVTIDRRGKYLVKENAGVIDEKARLGFATTGELIAEIRARIEIDGKLDYTTVGGE